MPDSATPMDCNPPGSSVHGDSPCKNTGVGCHALLQGIFPAQGSNPGLLHCGWILYQLTYQGSHFQYCATIQFSSVAQSYKTFCMDCSTPGLLVHHQLPELAQTRVCVGIIVAATSRVIVRINAFICIKCIKEVLSTSCE